MKLIILTFFIFQFNNLFGEPNDSIVSYLKSKRAINSEYYLFAGQELLQLCTDSLERIKFSNNISRDWKAAKSNSHKKEKKILFSLILKGINSLKPVSDVEEKSKIFIGNTLQYYAIDFTVDEGLLQDRFNSNEDLSICTSCKSMVIFLSFDPLLYLKARSKEPGYVEGKQHFPIAYTIQDCNTPILFTRRIKQSMLNILKNYKEPILNKIYNEIQDADINNRCD